MGYKLLDQIGAAKKIVASEIEPLNLTEGNISTLMLHTYLFDAKIPLQLPTKDLAEVEENSKTGGKRAEAKTKRGSKKKANRLQKTENKALCVIDNEKLSADEVSFSKKLKHIKSTDPILDGKVSMLFPWNYKINKSFNIKSFCSHSIPRLNHILIQNSFNPGPFRPTLYDIFTRYSFLNDIDM